MEHYDIEKDAIKYYFLEKIQSIISNKRTLNLMLNESNKKSKKNSQMELDVSNEKKSTKASFEEKEILNQRKFEQNENKEFKELKHTERKNLVRTSSVKRGSVSLANITNQKFERAKKLHIFLKTRENRRENNVEEMISEYRKLCQRNDELVQEDFKTQNSYLKSKTEQKSQNFN